MKYHAYRRPSRARLVLEAIRVIAGAAVLVVFGWALIVLALVVTP